MEKVENQNQLDEIQINHPQGCAILIQPKMTGKLSLVDLITLKRICGQLSRVNFEELKSHFIIGLGHSENLEEYIDIMKDEINFHESVNIITTIDI